MSRKNKGEYCFICDEELSTKFNWDRHLKSGVHINRKSSHDLGIITYKKSDYTIDNFIPLNISRVSNQHYFSHSIRIERPMDPICVVKNLLQLFIQFHHLDEPGWLPPFIIKETIQPRPEKSAYISRPHHQFIVEIPQIKEGRIEWMTYDRNLLDHIENQLECYYAIKVMTEMINRDMQDAPDDETYEYECGRASDIKGCYSFLSDGFIKKQLIRNFCDCFRINPNYIDSKPPKLEASLKVSIVDE